MLHFFKKSGNFVCDEYFCSRLLWPIREFAPPYEASDAEAAEQCCVPDSRVGKSKALCFNLRVSVLCLVIIYPGISPTANIFARTAICERAPIALAHKCEPECLLCKHRDDIEDGSPQNEKSTTIVVLRSMVTHPGIEPEFPAWEASVLTAWPMGLIFYGFVIISHFFYNCKPFFEKNFIFLLFF